MTDDQQAAITMFKAGERRIFGLRGPSQARTRQEIMRLLTGVKHPLAQCGINALTVKAREFDPTIPRY